MFYCCLIVVVLWFDLAVRSGVADVWLFFTFAWTIRCRGQLRGSHGLFRYMDYNNFSHFVIDVLNLGLCFVTDVLTERSGSLSEPGSILFILV